MEKEDNGYKEASKGKRINCRPGRKASERLPAIKRDNRIGAEYRTLTTICNDWWEITQGLDKREMTPVERCLPNIP